MALETPRRTPSVITAKLMDAARKSLAKLLPPGTSMPADIEQQLQKLLKSHQTPDHPPYALMIREAIEKLNDEGGSDEEAISKSIKLKYKSLPWGHKSLLSHHLKKLNEEGEIVRVSADRYILPPEENDTISPAEQKKEEIDNQQNLPSNDVSQSPMEADLKNGQNLKHRGAEPEVASELNVAGAEPEGVEERDELKEDHILVSEQAKPDDPSLPSQEKILGLKVNEEMYQVPEERGHELIVDAVKEQIQLQEQQDRVNELLNSLGTNLPRQEEISEVEASARTCQVCEEREEKMEDADQGLDKSSLAVEGERAEGQEVCEEQDDDEMEDADQVLDKISLLVEGERAEGQQAEEAIGDMKERDHLQSEMVEEIQPEEEQRGVLNVPEQVQEEPNQLLLEDQTDCRETHQLPERENQEDVELENVTVEKQIEKEPQDTLVDNQRVHMFDQQNQQAGVQDAVTGPGLLLQDMEIEIEEIEKLIESWRPEYEVIRSGVKQQEKQARAENIADNRQQDKGLELLNRMKGIKTCLSDLLKPANTKERSATASLETVEPEVPKNRQEKPEVRTPCEEVISQKMESSKCLEAMDVMLIEANQHIYHSHNPKRPAECPVMTLENILQRQAKQPKLSEQQDVESFSCTSVLERTQQPVGEQGDNLLKPLEADSAEGKTTLPWSVGGNSAENKEAEVCSLKGDQQSNSPCGAVKALVLTCEQENEESTELGNEAMRPDLSKEIQSGSFVPSPLEKQKEGILLIKEGKQPDLAIGEQRQSFSAQDMDQERVKQQPRLLNCGQHKKYVLESNAMQMSTVELSPSQDREQIEQPGMLLNYGPQKQFERAATAMPLLTPSSLSLINRDQIGWCRQSRTLVPHLSPAEAGISPSPSALQMRVVSRVAQQLQSPASSETFALSFYNSELPGERQQPKQQQLELSGIRSCLFKPPVLTAETLNPLKPTELEKIEPTYRRKLRSWDIASPLVPELGPASDRTLTGQSGYEGSEEKLPVHRGRPPKLTTGTREESPLSQKRLGRPPKPKPDAGEGSPFSQKRRGRPPKQKSDPITAVTSTEMGSSTLSPQKPRRGRGRPPILKPALAPAEEPKPLP